ncbi:MAG: hypothetical protein WBM52_08810, partial [Thiogranum sp.]
IADIGIHLYKLNGTRRVAEKIFHDFAKVSGYSDSEHCRGEIAWTGSTALSRAGRRPEATIVSFTRR